MSLKKIVEDGLLILDKENISTSEENYFCNLDNGLV
jgi:hypothetical protein